MRRGVLVLAVLALVVSACSSDPAETTTTVAVSDAAAETTTSTEATTTTASAAAETTTTSTAASSGGLAECVVGEWELDSQAFFDVVMAELEEAEEGEFVFVDGVYALVISDNGTFSSERRDWTFGFESEMGEFLVRINHIQGGMWVIDGDVLSTSTTASESAVIEFFIDGEPFLFPGGVSPVTPPEADFEGATVTCDGDALTATFDGFTSEWARVA
ncbi:MAG: hypothetical protein ACR2N2_05730 [Acidimicrobiia bacterium]